MWLICIRWRIFVVDCAESCRIQNPLMNSPESAGQIACFTVLKCVLRRTVYGNGKKKVSVLKAYGSYGRFLCTSIHYYHDRKVVDYPP